MGEVIQMLKKLDEIEQIGWACSAQNPDLLPEDLRHAKGGGKQRFREKASKHWQQEHPS